MVCRIILPRCFMWLEFGVQHEQGGLYFCWMKRKLFVILYLLKYGISCWSSTVWVHATLTAHVFRIQLKVYGYELYYMYFFTRLASKQVRWNLDLHLMKPSLFQAGIIPAITETHCCSSASVASCQWNRV